MADYQTARALANDPMYSERVHSALINRAKILLGSAGANGEMAEKLLRDGGSMSKRIANEIARELAVADIVFSSTDAELIAELTTADNLKLIRAMIGVAEDPA